MTKTITAFAAFLLVGAALHAQDKPESASTKTGTREKEIEDPRTTTPRPLQPTAVKESDLVRAAKKSPASRDKAKIQIDNASVKGSKGKLTEMGAGNLRQTGAAPKQNETIARYDKELDAWKKSVESGQKKVSALEQEIADLESLVNGFEENFYNEDEPGYREVLEEKYIQSQERLEKAREELGRARDEQQKLENSKPRIY